MRERERWRDETTDERAMVSNTAVQNSQSNSTKQITSNFLGGSSTHAVPSACIPRNLDQRGRRISPNPSAIFSSPFRLSPLASRRPRCAALSARCVTEYHPPPFHTSGLSVAPDTARISNSGCLTSVCRASKLPKVRREVRIVTPAG